MYNVIICDDDGVYAEYISSLIRKCQYEEIEMEIDICNSGEECISLINSGKNYDWLILDLQLGSLDGYEVASVYRNVSEDGLLFLCSGVYSPTVYSFYSRPYRFIEKDMDENLIIDYIKEGMKYLSKMNSERYYIGHIRGDKYTHEDDRNIVLFKKIEDLYMELQGDFEYISTSCLVNMKYVKAINNNSVILDTGIQLPIARSMVKNFKKRFMECIER